MTTMQELKAQADNSALIRKVQNISIWLGPEDAPEVEKLVGADGQLIKLPEAYQPLGMITKDDGATFTSDFDNEGVEAHGYMSEVREDPASQERTFQVNALESNRVTLEQAHGIDLSTVELDADGNLVFDEPEIPIRPFGRMVAIGSDGAGPGEFFMGRWYPRVKVSSIDDIVWSMTDPLGYNLTYKAFPDPVLGIPVRHLWAGAGFKATAAAAGFKTATGG